MKRFQDPIKPQLTRKNDVNTSLDSSLKTKPTAKLKKAVNTQPNEEIEIFESSVTAEKALKVITVVLLTIGIVATVTFCFMNQIINAIFALLSFSTLFATLRVLINISISLKGINQKLEKRKDQE